MPPVSANGIPVNTSRPVLHVAEHREQQNEDQQQRQRDHDLQAFAGRLQVLEGPPQVVQYPAGIFTCCRIAVSASATKEPMSRPRTLALTTTRRLPSSRLTWLGPGDRSREATSASGT